MTIFKLRHNCENSALCQLPHNERAGEVAALQGAAELLS
jgi:hypothetical protein